VVEKEGGFAAPSVLRSAAGFTWMDAFRFSQVEWRTCFGYKKKEMGDSGSMIAC
jgi:hypothetical protein